MTDLHDWDRRATELLGTTRRSTRVRGFAPWSPREETKPLLAQIKAVLHEYVSYLPLTLRQVFYRLVGAHGYSKTEASYERLGEVLNRARRARLVSMDAIRDDGGLTEGITGWESTNDFFASIRDQAKHFRLDRTAGQKSRVAVFCEAAGMVPQLAQRLVIPSTSKSSPPAGLSPSLRSIGSPTNWRLTAPPRCCISVTSIRPAFTCFSHSPRMWKLSRVSLAARRSPSTWLADTVSGKAAQTLKPRRRKRPTDAPSVAKPARPRRLRPTCWPKFCVATSTTASINARFGLSSGASSRLAASCWRGSARRLHHDPLHHRPSPEVTQTDPALPVRQQHDLQSALHRRRRIDNRDTAG